MKYKKIQVEILRKIIYFLMKDFFIGINKKNRGKIYHSIRFRLYYYCKERKADLIDELYGPSGISEIFAQTTGFWRIRRRHKHYGIILGRKKY